MSHHRSLRFLLVLLAATGVCVGLTAGTARAHNSLVSSDPADGEALTAAPAQIVWLFDKAVPLETMTVTLIDGGGARTDLAGSTHGPSGDTEVITPLPALQPGAVSVRWRLVGPDGHPITGRVDLTIGPAATTTALPTQATTPTETANTVPGVVAPASSQPPAVGGASVDAEDDGYSTSSLLRWVLRYGSYLAIMAVVGVLMTGAYVWSGAATEPLLRKVLSCSLIATAVLGFLSLLVVASDVSGNAPWASLGFIDTASNTDAGMAFMIRIVLAITMWLLLFQYRLDQPDVYWTAVSFAGLGLLATWAFAGHSRSMRWPEIGVLTDVAHHAAAAAWIGGLAIVGWIVIPSATSAVVVDSVRRFSRLATVSVAILVITGSIQTVRLVGDPTKLLDADHGQYLVAKLAVLAVMLALANLNRRRVDAQLDDPAKLTDGLGTLRKAIVAEFAIGLVIIGLTAAMVVSPPSTNGVADRDVTSLPAPLYYTL